ncbi:MULTISPECIES: sugar ABC transporter ATP-binding protein [unclassified Fusibacter]|uniref:sugar ABC transporter ATP-binding protein n=1 Tax=unclassified Fusibacter TaxID=2624464 RepID=UPI0010102B7F|nr:MULTISPECIES: ATP-binding cassette domain-containing protein [unclassified Fusibacter]MCK8060735.1 ATP-binding cassette domain-containing protein [Fusibacter sp. A2]NPE23030.1 ATP-binding cassette domain-containing protein [Fusibacter sp. A1]RXV59704.1 ATP-binding cassette domain-containing protein [Fusibacter sp. A1]
MSDVILRMEGITKEFPGVKALDRVNLNVYKNRVMALLGENGAGKSTLMKILSGVYQKTEGELYLMGEPLEVSGPKDAMEKGIAIIHQELNLINELSIAENIFLGRFPQKHGKIDWKALESKSEALLTKLNLKLNPKTLVKELSIGHQQMVEIAKALSFDARIIIMDEPTDALTDTESESLFDVIEELRAQGKSIVYISHRLPEIFKICDDVTVLRDGQFINESKVSEIDEDKLIELMVGRKLEEQYPYLDSTSNEVIFEVEKLSNRFVQDISFTLNRGEILGIAGLMGAGRTELAKSIYGAIKNDTCNLRLNDRKVNIVDEASALKEGIAYVSEDRKKDGLVLSLSVKKNMSLSSLSKYSNFMHIKKSSETKMADTFKEQMQIKTPSLDQIVKHLSGGNQQKVSIAKALSCDPKVLILDEPTRGVDVGAKKEIYELMNSFKEDGMGIIMISSEIPEILGICDRVLVMHEGKVAGILSRSEATQESIMRLAIGIEGAN